MNGPSILVRSMSQASIEDRHGNRWQYNSRSDRHSRVACWGILFDLLLTCPLLRRHVTEGKVGFGINHCMVDFKSNKKKDLDLVVCTPGTKEDSPQGSDFPALAKDYTLALTPKEAQALEDLPVLRQVPVGSVLVALEAKACMTAHVKAIPRLHDELNSSHLTIHGASDHAIAAGFAMVNCADTFVSSVTNNYDLHKYPIRTTKHRQPADATRVVVKLEDLPRRNRPGMEGFDALGIVVVECRNDASPVSVVMDRPAPKPNDTFHYDSMIRRVAQLYESKFASL